MFVHGKPFQPSVMFAAYGRKSFIGLAPVLKKCYGHNAFGVTSPTRLVYFSGVESPMDLYNKGRLLTLFTNIGLGKN